MKYNVEQTKYFGSWLKKLKDSNAKRRILATVKRLQHGLMGDWKPVGSKVSEIRIHCGKGYRIYYTKPGDEIIILLCGGDKSSQQKDIRQAKELAARWRELS